MKFNCANITLYLYNMADSDSEIEFKRQHNKREMEEDRPVTDTEEIIQQQECDELDRAASVLSSIDDIPELEDVIVQQPRSRRTRENDYLGVPRDPHARGDLSGNARRPISHTSTPMKPQTYNGDGDWESYLSQFDNLSASSCRNLLNFGDLWFQL